MFFNKEKSLLKGCGSFLFIVILQKSTWSSVGSNYGNDRLHADKPDAEMQDNSPVENNKFSACVAVHCHQTPNPSFLSRKMNKHE